MMRRIKEISRILQRHDNLEFERRLTARVGLTHFGTSASRRCAICGRSPPAVPLVVMAHIRPLEEGGTTDESNLIPLCEGTIQVSKAFSDVLDWCDRQSISKKTSFHDGLAKAQKTKPADIGCHKLFDAGLISRKVVRDIRQVRSQWGQHPKVRDSVFTPSLETLEALASMSRRRTATRLLRRWKEPFLSKEEEIEHACITIRAARQLTDKRTMRIASSIDADIQKELKSLLNSVSADTMSRYFYEHALLQMVNQPIPDLGGTLKSLKTSSRLAREAGNEAGWAASQLEWTHAALFSSPRLSDRRYRSLLLAQEEARIALSKTCHPGSLKLVRYQMNFHILRAQLHVRALKISKARESLSAARELRDCLTLMDGWTQYQAIHLNSVEGAILALEGKLDLALKLLARAIAPMTNGRGKKPEGVVDIAGCAAWILDKGGFSDEGGLIREILLDVRDGRSGFWPFTSRSKIPSHESVNIR